MGKDFCPLFLSEVMNLNVIISGCRENDRTCQKMLFDQHYKYATKVATLYCSNSKDVEEVVNDAFVLVFQKIHDYDSSKPFISWFRMFIIRTAINYYKKNLHYYKHTLYNDEFYTSSAEENEALSQLDSEEVLMLIKKLPKAYKIVLNLYAIEGYSHAEIAELLNISIGTSKSNLFKARSQFQKLLESLKSIIF